MADAKLLCGADGKLRFINLPHDLGHGDNMAGPVLDQFPREGCLALALPYWEARISARLDGRLYSGVVYVPGLTTDQKTHEITVAAEGELDANGNAYPHSLRLDRQLLGLLWKIVFHPDGTSREWGWRKSAPRDVLASAGWEEIGHGLGDDPPEHTVSDLSVQITQYQ